MSFTEKKKLLNKVILVYFAHKKYTHSFITLLLNHWCHMDYFNDTLTTFLGLEVVVTLLSMQGQKTLGFHQKYLNVCSEDKQRSYRFGTKWGWVINDRIFIFGWTISLIWYFYRPCLKCHFIIIIIIIIIYFSVEDAWCVSSFIVFQIFFFFVIIQRSS